MGPGVEDGRRGDDPDAGLGEELGSLRLHDDPSADSRSAASASQARARRAVERRAAIVARCSTDCVTDAQPRTTEDQRVGAQVAQPAAEGLGCIDHERRSAETARVRSTTAP